MSALFPPAFSDLECLAFPWVDLDSMDARYRARQDMDFAALEALYAATAPRLGEIMAHLDSFGSASLPPAELRLFRLMLGLVEAAQAVEFFGAARLPGAPYPHKVTAGGAAAASG